MEVLAHDIVRFLSVSYGDCYGYGFSDGSGDGYDSGFGYGSGDGSGDGFGDGSGDGDGYGFGYGYGYGYGKEFNHEKVYQIDHFQTIIYSIHGNIARGAIILDDLTLKDCYIAKVGDSFAHGNSIHKAYEDAQAKAMQKVSEEERIAAFWDAHSDKGKRYSYEDLFCWHNILTGSCEFGRKAFCKEHGITEKDSFTVAEFVELTKDEYGGEVIRKILN